MEGETTGVGARDRRAGDVEGEKISVEVNGGVGRGSTAVDAQHHSGWGARWRGVDPVPWRSLTHKLL
eukprot:SAG11_NODE_23259_length_392_cov_0.532423_1_plen_66_part_01